LICPASEEILEDNKYVIFSSKWMIALAIPLILFNCYRENNTHGIPKIITISQCLQLLPDLKQRHHLLSKKLLSQ
jgi:branched-subunit amino acid transport protein AzlD